MKVSLKTKKIFYFVIIYLVGVPMTAYFFLLDDYVMTFLMAISTIINRISLLKIMKSSKDI